MIASVSSATVSKLPGVDHCEPFDDLKFCVAKIFMIDIAKLQRELSRNWKLGKFHSGTQDFKSRRSFAFVAIGPHRNVIDNVSPFL